MTVRTLRQRHEVRTGESLYSLASEYLGSRDRWRELALYNNIDVLTDTVVGQTITIPTLEEMLTIAQSLASQLPDSVSGVISQGLDLSGIKQPDTGEFSLISWIL